MMYDLMANVLSRWITQDSRGFITWEETIHLRCQMKAVVADVDRTWSLADEKLYQDHVFDTQYLTTPPAPGLEPMLRALLAHVERER